MTIGLVPKVINAVDMILLISKELWVVNPHVVEWRYIKCIIGSESIRVDNAIGLYFFLNDGQECLCLGIRNK
jgi:hypothetical protein